MAESSWKTHELQGWLQRMQAGDRGGLDELLRHACDRLQRLARRMLGDHPAVKRWAQTDDVLQGALLRLARALESIQPASMRDFFALATQQIRRELVDLARHYYGPHGLGAHHASDAALADPAEETHDPDVLAGWSDVHEQIERLPEEEREVVGLLFYQGLPQAEAAAVLNVTVRTVQRRWHAALVRLHRTLKDDHPALGRDDN
jgi:RNA polymerase sigma factor (sigma-70 family)